jgi:large subunit ribosomal protein L6
VSRIGKQPIEIPAGVSVSIDPGRVMVNGPLGNLQQQVPQRMKIEQAEGTITVTRPTERGQDRALHGLTRTLVANMVEGVTKGFSKNLELVGVGYKAEVRPYGLQLALGYSHPIEIDPPTGISFALETPQKVRVAGADKEVVGEIAAKIRALRVPDPYKAKGVKYAGEYIRRKAGKAGKVGAKA